MAKKFPDQQMLFASWQRPRDIRNLSEILVSMLLLNLQESISNTRQSCILMKFGVYRYSEAPPICYGAQRLGHWNAECR